MRRGLIIIGTLLVAAFGLQVIAEVRGTTDRKGRQRGTETSIGTDRPADVWRAIPGNTRSGALNPLGSQMGDLFPTVAESNVTPYIPWVVWSRHTGVDYDLVWSRWRGTQWEPIRQLFPGENVGDDLDADLRFDAHGRAFVTWWRDEGGVGRVYMSFFLQSRFGEPFLVSPKWHDARYPVFEAISDELFRVRYQTPEGTFDGLVAVGSPVTITDDLNPLDYIFNKATIYVANP